MAFSAKTVRTILQTEIQDWVRETILSGSIGSKTFSHGQQWNFYMRVQSGLPLGLGEDLCLCFANITLSKRLQNKGILSGLIQHFHNTLGRNIILEQVFNPHLEQWAERNMLPCPAKDTPHSCYYLPKRPAESPPVIVKTDSSDPVEIYRNTYMSRPLVDEYVRENNVQLLQDVIKEMHDTPDRLTLQRAISKLLQQQEAYNPPQNTQ